MVVVVAVAVAAAVAAVVVVMMMMMGVKLTYPLGEGSGYPGVRVAHVNTAEINTKLTHIMEMFINYNSQGNKEIE
jgi:hypothetical protein